ncbi:hypothetical protein [Fictibacillus barbaricus]|uniref:Uncharacterized protein n=1 Tax=Fictibacillus barbaricus TaxID=182136 RepID=A0ABS2ZCW3_9BACL|nr:hypothetical protein [Fictibacillus barbaricus]MBN3546033.1 hypothetical protein [Fictibacillus barbaricus]GGB58091.1 hypothetical protein GCM10007199_24950 [Fictibacillus barbaricus]
MKEWVRPVIEWAQTIGKQIPKGMKGVVEKLKTHPSLSVSDLASIIMFHPDTEIKREEWLGLTFHFYKLRIGRFSFSLETKGKDNNYILMCQVFDEVGIVSEYISYNEEMSLHDRIKVPKIEMN